MQIRISIHIILVLIISLTSCAKDNTLDTKPVVTPGDTTERITIGPLTLIYIDAQMPYTMDCSWATLKNADGTMTFFETAMGKFPYYFRHTGPYSAPLKTQLSKFNWDYNGYNNTWYSGCWLDNIYKVSNDTLVGFVHREDLYPANKNKYPRDRYFIGLARSFDGGTNWKYLGDIIGTIRNTLTTAGGSNIGGVPCLVVDDNFMVYYNEREENELSTALSVARAKVSDVIQAIKKDQVCQFVKYNNGSWTEDAFTGIGSNIIPDFQPPFDFHSDAAYCKPLGKYLITVQTHWLNKLYLYQSTDGVNWGERITLDSLSGYSQPYSSFVGFDSESSNDCFTVGSEFYIYINRKSTSNYDYDEMYYRKVTIR